MGVRPEELEAMRDEQERVTLVDTCRVERRIQGAYQPATFDHASDGVSIIYQGPCDIAFAVDLRFLREHPMGDADRTERMWNVAVPTDGSESIHERDIVVVLSSRDADTPTELNVELISGAGFASRRILVCKELVI